MSIIRPNSVLLQIGQKNNRRTVLFGLLSKLALSSRFYERSSFNLSCELSVRGEALAQNPATLKDSRSVELSKFMRSVVGEFDLSKS